MGDYQSFSHLASISPKLASISPKKDNPNRKLPLSLIPDGGQYRRVQRVL